MRPRQRTLLAHCLAHCLVLAATLHAAVALADARVDVEVKDVSGRLASGQVTLSLGTVSKNCATVGGRCSITLPAGRYQVRLVPVTGAVSTSQVTVPATGTIRLALAITPASTTTPPPQPKPPVTTTAQGVATGTPPLRDVSRGTRMLVQGSVLDPAGRLTNATISLQQNGRAVAQTKCVGGRFAMFDLTAGTYDVLAIATNGTRATTRITVGTALLRPTLRLATP
jgi:hypothetical protein